jgi:hypothetical protein
MDNCVEVLQGTARCIRAKLLSERRACLGSPYESFLDEASVIGMHHLEKLRKRRGAARRVTVKQAKHLRRPRVSLCCQVSLPTAELGALLGGSELCFAFAQLFQHDLPCPSEMLRRPIGPPALKKKTCQRDRSETKGEGDTRK